MSNWEKCVIGTVVASPAAFDEAAELLPSDFTGPNVIVWSEIVALAQRRALELRALTEALNGAPDIARHSDIGTPADYIADCLTYRGTALKEYVNQVVNESTKRALRRNLGLIAAAADQETTTADEILDFAESQILKLRRNRTDKGLTIGDLMAIFMPRLQDTIAGNFKPAWTPEVLAVKNIVDFAEDTDYIIVAGRPGDGKSSWLRFEARKHVDKGGKVAIINMEGSAVEYARNWVALKTGIDSKKLKNGRGLSPEDLERVVEATREVHNLPLWVKDMASPTVAEVTRYGRMMAAEEGITMLAVDYIQLMTNGIENKVNDVGMTSQQLRAFALNMHIPVFACAQLSRDIEKRNHEEKAPKLSDLRDSGSLEQDGSIIVFPRPIWANPSENEIRQFPENIDENGRVHTQLKAVPIQFHVLKNRNGETGVSEPVTWVKSTGNYRTLYRGPNGSFQS